MWLNRHFALHQIIPLDWANPDEVLIAVVFGRAVIHVSQPWLPDFEDLKRKLQTPWSTGILTHNGPLVQEFEQRLQELWGVKHVIAVSNGTLAIQLAIKALKVSGDVITTPFTWIATASAIRWEGGRVRFADISPSTLCLDPNKVEKIITENTGAIMPVNVFANPPDFKKFQMISETHGIPLIYDAAHAASTLFNGRSSLSYGSISTTSFHATKLIHTGEGGACVTDDDEVAERLRALRFFGFAEDGSVSDQGTNAKMTEIHAALGLCCLDNLGLILEKRRVLSEIYTNKLEHCEGLQIPLVRDSQFVPNHLYFPVLFSQEEILQSVMSALIARKIYPRRYFYPSLNTMPIFSSQSCPISEGLAPRILCLPLHVGLSENEVSEIVEIVASEAI